MRKYFVFLLIFISFSGFAQTIGICSWNLKNFGKSKSDTQMAYIANVVKQFDVIAIQEVVAGPGGAQAVARLADELNRSGNRWDYVISDPTSSSAYKRERYAFLWNRAKVRKKGDAWLEVSHGLLIDREPYYCEFEFGKKSFTLASFHAITKAKQPETEIKYFKFLPAQYPNHRLIFCGDFNIPQSHNVFIPLRKMGYTSALTGQKTTLKQKYNNGYLASEFDNFYFSSSMINAVKTGIVHFYQDFADLAEARLVSDHVPVFMQFSIN